MSFDLQWGVFVSILHPYVIFMLFYVSRNLLVAFGGMLNYCVVFRLENYEFVVYFTFPSCGSRYLYTIDLSLNEFTVA